MAGLSRKEFLATLGIAGGSLYWLQSCGFKPEPRDSMKGRVQLKKPKKLENIFSYIRRQKGEFDLDFYRKIIGAANEYKEGDEAQGLAAADQESRLFARQLLANSQIKDLQNTSVFTDELSLLIEKTTESNRLPEMTLGELKTFVLRQPEEEIKKLMPGFGSDLIACLVRLMSNDELIAVGQKVFNPLHNSQIGSKGYMSARIQPNSPTDNIQDIQWQVFNAWSYAVGDLVLGTNPVSSETESVSAIEKALFEIIQTFGLEDVIPNCVLSHIDVQAAAEEVASGTTGIWFQSLAGTVNANQTFDLSIEKMQNYARLRNGRYGLYAETGQGADFTNGHGEGFDMVIHEARKYGFLRALQKQIISQQADGQPQPWIHVNDVAGFIGPEVFKSREQLVRCCLEDTVMGKLHGLTIGLDICSTLHMDVTLEDLDWCIEQIMPANPAYLMALPTKNDPMLSYLTTAFHNHLKVREKFGYKINEAMWAFFKKLEIIDEQNRPTEHFGDPVWVYYQYLKAKGDGRSYAAIKDEGLKAISAIEKRGVPIAQGYGENYFDPEPQLARKVKSLYEDAKVSLWTELSDSFITGISGAIPMTTQSIDRKDYVYHPPSGEKLSEKSIHQLKAMRTSRKGNTPDIQVIISDGLNARAIMDEGHLMNFINQLKKELSMGNLSLAPEIPMLKNGRVRAGYAIGEQLLGEKNNHEMAGILHIIGERPGSGHHNFSVYITVTSKDNWSQTGKVDHDITKVVSGISDTALMPELAAEAVGRIVKSLRVKG